MNANKSLMVIEARKIFFSGGLSGKKRGVYKYANIHISSRFRYMCNKFASKNVGFYLFLPVGFRI